MIPHPIPYQGSKRNLASAILSVVGERCFRRLYEPLAGSAAVTIAAARANIAQEFVIGDSLEPLVAIWRLALLNPIGLADRYERIWIHQRRCGIGYYDRIRAEYNASGDPAKLLYLLARCVKNSPRFNRAGEFNQGSDRRRLGMRPEKMRRQLVGVSTLLSGRTRLVCGDFERTIADATPQDLVYLDPPWQGTSLGPHKRYHQGLDRERVAVALADLNRRRVPFLLSYDGRCGEKTYGERLPANLGARRFDLDAGRSSQATLNGRVAVTVESLYVSQSLTGHPMREPKQVSLWTGEEPAG